MALFDAAYTYYLVPALTAPTWFNFVVCLLLILLMAANGLEHGHIWGRGGWKGERPPLYRRFTVHFVDGFIHEPAYYLLALVTMANPITIIATAWMGRPIFEGAINMAAGRRWFDDGREPEVFYIRWNGKVMLSVDKAQGKPAYVLMAIAGWLLWCLHQPISLWILSFYPVSP
ncbi:hypothetical protein [Salisaeta icosahedral phage 1]|uniref:hypothetical protein n=1 Tax=Salisaeta icosahedral phage 1 TaxID=1183239 RepID=UPI00025EA92B|nr:hypothetical protein A322_gp30 [Salisaeta icosahedral phage 1]AFJ21485.1 hypothetical protein [Salisaeta icosahedral phage 1]